MGSAALPGATEVRIWAGETDGYPLRLGGKVSVNLTWAGVGSDLGKGDACFPYRLGLSEWAGERDPFRLGCYSYGRNCCVDL
jgi:hypothetical protein